MRLFLLALAAWTVCAQDPPNPNLTDRYRQTLERIDTTPSRTYNDSAARERAILRAPLYAPPGVSLTELQSTQTSLIRINDLLNAEAQRNQIDAQLAAGGTTPQLYVPLRPIIRPGFRDRVRTDPNAQPLLHIEPAARLLPPPANAANLALGKPTRQSHSGLYPSRAGVDGLLTGSFGFHTGLEANPWWQVDLQRTGPLHEIRVYNSRLSPEDANTLEILLSDDGMHWKSVYKHVSGTLGAPLRVPLGGIPARYVRLQLPGRSALHLDEVEVY